MAREARRDFGHAHFPRLKNGCFRHFQVYIHHTLNTVLEGSTEGVTVSTCTK